MSPLVGLIPLPCLIRVLTFIRMWSMLVVYKRSESRGEAMEDQLQNKDSAQIGDKVRLRSGTYVKERGVVQAKVDELLEIRLDEGTLIHAGPEEITNYS